MSGPQDNWIPKRERFRLSYQGSPTKVVRFQNQEVLRLPVTFWYQDQAQLRLNRARKGSIVRPCFLEETASLPPEEKTKEELGKKEELGIGLWPRKKVSGAKVAIGHSGFHVMRAPNKHLAVSNLKCTE